MIAEEPQRFVDKELVCGLAAYTEERLRERIANSSGPPNISAETKKGVTKRVTPKNVAEFSTAEKLPTLISIEIQTLGDRIRLYPFTARYRDAINLASRDMMGAWMLHSYSLRQGELYIIQERGVELLKFLRDVAMDLGLPAADRSKSFEKAFKKRFERRLRERHRLIHAHERPSLTSRVIDFGVAAEEKDKDLVAETLGNLIAQIAQLLPGEATDDPQELQRRIFALRDSYATIADREASDIFEMFATEISKTLGVPFKISGDSKL